MMAPRAFIIVNNEAPAVECAGRAGTKAALPAFIAPASR